MRIFGIVKIIISAFLCVVIIHWVLALINCEILTAQHYDEFKDAYKQNNMLIDMDYFKVLSCNLYKSDIAQVYYIGKGNSCADVLTFQYNAENGLWEEITWNTIWSKGGSASEVIWPYWWHFIYGGF